MSIQEEINQKSISFRQRLFARFMASENEKIHELYKDRKVELFSQLTGTILEIGPGTGVNLQFLKCDNKWIGIEPNIAMYSYLMKEADRLGMEIQLCRYFDEDLQIKNRGVDAVISTLVLCSVTSVSETLKEVLRILKPGGKFVFIEHVEDKSSTFRYWIQKVLPYTPWRYFSDGCNPGRDIGNEIDTAGFSQVNWQLYHQEGEGIIRSITRPHICGVAIK
jgi:ubiquinone/menaquinone biosynthesis C-methylase UbiE